MQTIWKGAISFGLVNVPVKMFTATQDNDIPMRMLHKEYNVPIRYSRTCPKCEKEVSWSEIVKGYEYEEGHYVTFDKKELEELASKSSREIRISDFVELKDIDPIYYQKTYYLAPEETGKHAYMLLVKALEDTEKVGIANVTIRNKSSLAAIRVIDGVLGMETMFYADEIRERSQLPNLPEKVKVDRRELDMAKMIIDQLTTNFEPDKYEDEYRERLMDAIEDKVEGKEVKVAPEEKVTSVLDLMDALQASLKELKATPTDKGERKSSRSTKSTKSSSSNSTSTGSKKKSASSSRRKKTGA